MTTMNHSQLIQFLINENYTALAMDFADVSPEDCVDGEIDTNLVKAIIDELDPSGRILREIQANVTSYVYLSMDKEKCASCNYESGHHSLCPENFINSNSYQYQECQ
jgi:hypothetical protein